MSLASIVAPEYRPGNVKFEKIWNRAKDKDVAVVVLGVNGTTLCIDGRHALTAKEVIDCCKHGCLIRADGGYYWPVFLMVEGDVAKVKCISDSSSTPILKTFTSYQAS